MSQPRLVDRDEVDFLLAAGETPQRICERLGVPPAAIARDYYRAGRREDARPFGALAARLNRTKKGA